MEEKKIKVGIMGAMKEEVDSIKQLMKIEKIEVLGDREYIHGTLHDIETILVFSRWGKVAASSTATTLVNKYDISCMIFIGVAGAISKELNIGDVVIGERLYQHDMNASPLFSKHQIPLTGRVHFESNAKLVSNAIASTTTFLASLSETLSKQSLKRFSIKSPKFLVGTIATGDEFISSIERIRTLESDMPNVLAAEMEGGAVAQVCDEHNVPFVVLRTISDKADHSAHIDFPKFIEEICCHYSSGIINEMYRRGLSF